MGKLYSKYQPEPLLKFVSNIYGLVIQIGDGFYVTRRQNPAIKISCPDKMDSIWGIAVSFVYIGGKKNGKKGSKCRMTL